MIGQYIEYCGNIFRIKGFSAYKEAVEVELIVQNSPILCTNDEHAKWIEDGEMWPTEFFEFANFIPNGELIYGDK